MKVLSLYESEKCIIGQDGLFFFLLGFSDLGDITERERVGDV